MLIVPDKPAPVAVTTAVPTAAPVTTPPALTLAIPALFVDHESGTPDMTLPDASRTLAVTVELPPTTIVAGDAARLIEAGIAGAGIGRLAPAMLEYRRRFGVPAGTAVNTFGVAPATTAAATCAGVAAGFAERYNAATPATCGDAMDVPPIYAVAESLVM